MPAVRISAVQLWSTRSATPNENRDHALRMLEKAAAEKPDLVVLPEAVAMLCYPDDHSDFSYFDVAEPVPGPTSDVACRTAARFGVNVVMGLIERRPTGGQNLALVMNRDGQIVGRYEKIHEPEVCRLNQHALVGSEIPVFDLDFGRIGVFICWDLHYPELPSILAAKGAELLVFPHLIALPNDEHFGLRVRARAVDTGLPVVGAGMRDAHNHNGTQADFGPTFILDAEGVTVATSLEPRADIVSETVRLGADSPNRRRIDQVRMDARYEVYTDGYGRQVS